MASMNLLGFSLSPQEHNPSTHQDQTVQVASSRFGFNPDGISAVDNGDNCFDLPSHHDSSTPQYSLNHLPPFAIYQEEAEAFHRNSNNIIHTTQDWKENYNNANLLLGTSCNNQNNVNNHHHQQQQQQQPKLENFLGRHSFGDHDHQAYGGNSASGDFMFPNCSLQLPAESQQTRPEGAIGGETSDSHLHLNSSNSIGLSMIKTWLRNQPPQSDNNNNNNTDNNNENGGSAATRVQSLSLSMSTGSQSSSSLPLLTANVSGESSTSENKQPPAATTTAVALDSTQTVPAAEPVQRKSIDTFGQRTSIYRGVTRHRWTGRYEAHLWDNSCRREGQTRKGRQVYLGGYDKEDKAARSYDLAALKYWGTTTTTNFPISHYEKELEEMKHMTRQEYVASLRRKSSGFSRGASIYRGVTRHHQHGRWQARIGRVAGNKDLYLGTFSTQEEAAEAYDVAAIKFRGLSAVTNFDMSRYDVKSILDSTTLPIGGAAKRLKEIDQQQVEQQQQQQQQLTLDSTDGMSLNSHLISDIGLSNYHQQHGFYNALSFQQPQQHIATTTMHHHPYHPYGQRLNWCKQEQDSSDHHDVYNNNSTHNFFQSANSDQLQSFMSMDSAASMDNNSSGSYAGDGNGYGGGYMIPMGTTATSVVGNDGGNQSYESVYGNGTSADPYHARNLYYQNSAIDNQGNNTWVPTAIPAPRPTNMVLYQYDQ